jgi:hypothetical protein
MATKKAVAEYKKLVGDYRSKKKQETAQAKEGKKEEKKPVETKPAAATAQTKK